VRRNICVHFETLTQLAYSAVLQKAYYDSVFRECSRHGHLVKGKSFPFPSLSGKERRARTAQSILASLFLLIPLSSIAGTLAAFHTEERRRKASFIQVKTGVSLSAFWVANFLSDLLPIGLVPFIVMAVMASYTDNASMFVGGVERALCTFALLSGFSLSVIPFSYLVSRQFRFVTMLSL
jgi:ABC-type dipeptide/oligopeptide/nickel transport system permease component